MPKADWISIYGGGVFYGIGDHAAKTALERQPDGSTMYRSGDLSPVLPNGNTRIPAASQEDADQDAVREPSGDLWLNRKKDAAGYCLAIDEELGLSYMTASRVPSDTCLKPAKNCSESDFFMIPEFFVEDRR